MRFFAFYVSTIPKHDVIMSLTGDLSQPNVCPHISHSTHIFSPVLINRQMYRSKASPSYLLLDNVLVDPVNRCAIMIVTTVMGLRVERRLHRSRARGSALMMS
jgi:hypothetical protein